MNQYFQYFLLLITILWLIAVFKVFVLDDGTVNLKPLTAPKFHTDSKYTTVLPRESVVARRSPDAVHRISYQKSDSAPHSGSEQEIKESIQRLKSILGNGPKSNSPRNDYSGEQAVAPVAVNAANNNNNNNNQQQTLQWPPVLPDGTISESDGYDIMAVNGLKVPKFWTAPPGTDLDTIGSHINGQETIFLMIASYCDFQCKETITSAFQRADHPERVFVGAVDQLPPVDSKGLGCLDIEKPCSEDPNQYLCKYRDQISVYKMDASTATGPVTARHIGDRMYRGQYYVMQMDAHCYFVNHWDSKIIQQFKNTKNEMAVLR
jgi:hypothetical protein